MSKPRQFEIMVLDDDGHQIERIVGEGTRPPAVRVTIGTTRSYFDLLPGQSLVVGEPPDPRLRKRGDS